MTTRAIEASAQARGVSEETRPTSAPSPHLQAQQLLNQFYSGAQLPEHGRPDAETRQALRDFQHTRGLHPSGEPDAATLEELGRAIAWQAHEEAALGEPEAAPVPTLSEPPSQQRTPLAIPPHLSHLAPDSLSNITLPSARRMTSEQLQRVASDLSGRFDAEPDPKIRRQYARQLLRMESELASRIADAPRDASELSVLPDVAWDEGSPNAGIVGDLHPFQNHDLWVSELEHGPQGLRRPRPVTEEDSEAPDSGGPESEPIGGTARTAEQVLERARNVGIESVPVVPGNDLQQGVGTAAGIAVSLANIALESVALAGGEAILLVAGTVNSLKKAGDAREARGELRGLMMAAHLFDSRGRLSSSGRISRQTMEGFIQRRYGQETAADTVTGAGADGPRRVALGRERGIDRVLRHANEALEKVDRAYAELSDQEQAGVDLNELREEALAEFQRRTFEEVAPHARRYEVAVD